MFAIRTITSFIFIFLNLLIYFTHTNNFGNRCLFFPKIHFYIEIKKNPKFHLQVENKVTNSKHIKNRKINIPPCNMLLWTPVEENK